MLGGPYTSLQVINSPRVIAPERGQGKHQQRDEFPNFLAKFQVGHSQAQRARYEHRQA